MEKDNIGQVNEEEEEVGQHSHLTEDELLQLDSRKNRNDIKTYIEKVWKAILEIRKKYGNYSKRCLLVAEGQDFNRKRPSSYKKFKEAKQDIDNIFENFRRRRMNFKQLDDYSNVMERLLRLGVEQEYPVQNFKFRVMVHFYKLFMDKYCPDEIYDIVSRYEFYYYDNDDDNEKDPTRRDPTRSCNMFERLFVSYMKDEDVDWIVKDEFRVFKDPFSWYPRPQEQRKVTYCIKSESTDYLSEIINQIEGASGLALYLSLTVTKVEQVYSTINPENLKNICDLYTNVKTISNGCSKRSSIIDCHWDCDKNCDMAFIDDIHLILEDPFGCNYTRVLLYLKASHIYVYGQASAIPTIRHICEIMGDSFNVQGTEPKEQEFRQAILDFDPTATRILQRMWKKALKTAFHKKNIMDIEKFLNLYLNLHECSIPEKPMFRFRDVETLLGMAKELSKSPQVYLRMSLSEILRVCALPEEYVGENKGPVVSGIKSATNQTKHLVSRWLYNILNVGEACKLREDDETISTSKEDFPQAEFAYKFLYRLFPHHRCYFVDHQEDFSETSEDSLEPSEDTLEAPVI